MRDRQKETIQHETLNVSDEDSEKASLGVQTNLVRRRRRKRCAKIVSHVLWLEEPSRNKLVQFDCHGLGQRTLMISARL